MPKKNIRDGEGNLIPDRRKTNNGKYLKLAISLLAIVIGWLFLMNSQADSKIERVQSDYTEITAQLRQLQNDVRWIKDTLQDKYRKRGGEEK